MSVSVSDTSTTDPRVSQAKRRPRVGEASSEDRFEYSSDRGEGRVQEDKVNLAEDITAEMFGHAAQQKRDTHGH